MPWRVVQLSAVDASDDDLTDAELLSVYVVLRNNMKGPYDDSNATFTAYLKMSDLVGRKLYSESKSGVLVTTKIHKTPNPSDAGRTMLRAAD